MYKVFKMFWLICTNWERQNNNFMKILTGTMYIQYGSTTWKGINILRISLFWAKTSRIDITCEVLIRCQPLEERDEKKREIWSRGDSRHRIADSITNWGGWNALHKAKPHASLSRIHCFHLKGNTAAIVSAARLSRCRTDGYITASATIVILSTKDSVSRLNVML